MGTLLIVIRDVMSVAVSMGAAVSGAPPTPPPSPVSGGRCRWGGRPGGRAGGRPAGGATRSPAPRRGSARRGGPSWSVVPANQRGGAAAHRASRTARWFPRGSRRGSAASLSARTTGETAPRPRRSGGAPRALDGGPRVAALGSATGHVNHGGIPTPCLPRRRAFQRVSQVGGRLFGSILTAWSV
jgi:hypothetical protein